jgi:ankyrin repeat protein
MFAVFEQFRIPPTPLYYAALCGFDDLVEHLVVKYPQHVNTSGGFYVTPLFAALAGRRFQTAKLLRHKGAHGNARGCYGRTPLDSAAWYGDLEMVQVLLDYKPDVNSQDDDGWTPIISLSNCSAFEGTLLNIPQLFHDVARLLLEHGADVNARNEHGSAPLHGAAGAGRVDVVRVLLEHGANVGAENCEGKTPLHAAAENERVDVVRVLLEHGANAGTEDEEGRTPLQIASAMGYDEIVRLLSEHVTEGLL